MGTASEVSQRVSDYSHLSDGPQETLPHRGSSAHIIFDV
jgi:hypothetical protein